MLPEVCYQTFSNNLYTRFTLKRFKVTIYEKKNVKSDWFNNKFDMWIKEAGGANATCG